MFYPSLTETGFIEDPLEIADFLLSDFFTSHFSQSVSAYGQVASLQYLITKNQNNMTKLKTDLQSTLNTYFSRYYSKVNVDVFLNSTIENPDKYEISISIVFIDDKGRQHSLTRIASSKDSRFYSIIQKING